MEPKWKVHFRVVFSSLEGHGRTWRLLHLHHGLFLIHLLCIYFYALIFLIFLVFFLFFFSCFFFFFLFFFCPSQSIQLFNLLDMPAGVLPVRRVTEDDNRQLLSELVLCSCFLPRLTFVVLALKVPDGRPLGTQVRGGHGRRHPSPGGRAGGGAAVG